MPGLSKKLKSFKNQQILGIVGLAVLLFGLYRYSQNKNLFKVGYNNQQPLNTAKKSSESSSVTPSSNSNTYAPYNGAATSVIPTSSTKANELNKPIANPSDLLPDDSNSAWSSLNPVSDLKNVNLLNPSQMVGINTQGSSLRNANLQLRSEPPNPRMNTNNCPWNISTIEGDNMRKTLEIGSQ
jgi:hypothetical protein